MEQLQNRNDIRIQNQLKIFEILKREKTTITDIAAQLNISFTATSNIVDELVKQGYLSYVNSEKKDKNRGRIPTLVQLNLSKGVVAGVDISTRNIQVVLCTLDNEIIARKELDSFFITTETLEQIEVAIRDLLTLKEVNGRPLVYISIASPGLIRPDNFEYVAAYRVKDSEKLNPVLYFKNAFNVEVSMYNHIQVSCLSELKFGAFPDKNFNGLFLHIGLSSGFSFIFKGKLFSGSNGFAGEVATFSDNIPDIKDSWTSRPFCFWSMYVEIQKARGLSFDPEDTVDVAKIIEDYKNGDPIVVKIVDKSILYNALTIISLSTMLDFQYVVLEGKILRFGEDYLRKLRKAINDNSKLEIRSQLLPSTLKETNATLGACYIGCSKYLFNQLEHLARKKLGQPDFTINKAFDII